MAIAKNRKRIMITVSDEMANKILFYSNKMGVTQSSLCSQFVGQAIMGYDKAFDLMDNMAKKVLDSSRPAGDSLKGQMDIGELLELSTTEKSKVNIKKK